jgi:hypothetical protein
MKTSTGQKGLVDGDMQHVWGNNQELMGVKHERGHCVSQYVCQQGSELGMDKRNRRDTQNLAAH